MARDSLEQALEKVFEAAQKHAAASWFSLPGGGRLFQAGDPADTLYLLRAGRLGVFRQDHAEGEQRLFGVVTPGEPVGEMALITGTPHTASVVALRDSEVLALPAEAFLEEVRRVPELMVELARLALERAREGVKDFHDAPAVFGFVAATGRPIRPFIDRVAGEMERRGHTVRIVDSGALASAAEWFSRVEQSHDYVLYVAERHEVAWAHLVLRQVDRLFLVGWGLEAPPPGWLFPDDPLAELRNADLILFHPEAVKSPSGTDLWLDAVTPARWFHVRDKDAADVARIVRLLTATSVGLVLSGGGARAFAHIGAIEALRRAGVPLDFLGGSSMGAIIAASVAIGWPHDELERRMKKAFVESSPLDDVVLPILAMTRGRKVDARLEEHFGEQRIADLWRPFFAVSSNLTTGTWQVHRRGVLRQALRASISLPGVMPPVVLDGQVLVDGAVMKSFPTDLMRRWHDGPVVGVDVTRARGVDPRVLAAPTNWLKWFGSGEWRRGPPIVSVLMRSATLTTASDLSESRRTTDLLVIPKPEGVEIRDWKAYDQAVANGRDTMAAALEGLKGSVETLRRRQETYQQNEPLIVFDDVPAAAEGGAEGTQSEPPGKTVRRSAAPRGPTGGPG
jgi:NTE family protein